MNIVILLMKCKNSKLHYLEIPFFEIKEHFIWYKSNWTRLKVFSTRFWLKLYGRPVAPERIWRYLGQKKFCHKLGWDSIQKQNILKALFQNMVGTCPLVPICSGAPACDSNMVSKCFFKCFFRRRNFMILAFH